MDDTTLDDGDLSGLPGAGVNVDVGADFVDDVLGAVLDRWPLGGGGRRGQEHTDKDPNGGSHWMSLHSALLFSFSDYTTIPSLNGLRRRHLMRRSAPVAMAIRHMPGRRPGRR